MFIMIGETIVKKRYASNETCLQVGAQDMFHLWHRRYGQLGHKSLETLNLCIRTSVVLSFLKKTVVKGIYYVS